MRPRTRPRNGRYGCACATSRFLALTFTRTTRWSSSPLPATVTVPPPGSVASSAICAGPRAGHPAFFTLRPTALTATFAAGVSVPSISVSAPFWTRSSPIVTSVFGFGWPSAGVGSPGAACRVKRLRSVSVPAASRSTVAQGFRRLRKPMVRRVGHSYSMRLASRRSTPSGGSPGRAAT